MKLIKTMMMAASVALIAAPMALPTAAAAQEFPLVGGQYSDITGITVKDGGGLAYASYLADQWVKKSGICQVARLDHGLQDLCEREWARW